MGDDSYMQVDFPKSKPFLRWAGSKSKLLPKLFPFLPKTFNKYVEPFFGSGSLFFAIGPKRAVLSDQCKELIDTYKAVRDGLPHVLRYLRPLRIDKNRYYEIRENQSEGKYKRAAEFIYLNKTCWNGLYRVNLAGKFNVPFGLPKSEGIATESDLRECSRLLSSERVKLHCRDFEISLQECNEGDFVFLDPPYVTTHRFNGFAEWNETIFSWKDQVRLAQTANELVAQGVNVLITNAQHSDIEKLYSHFQKAAFSRQSTLASDTSRRVRVEEAIFFAGPDMPRK